MSLSNFESFLYAFGATRLLLQRAHEHGFLIEGLMLYALIVGGFCRICMVLKEQIDKESEKINEKYIYQGSGKSAISEREIYRLTLNNGVISKKLFNELNDLYNIRNKLVHRFFISKIEYSNLESVCARYEHVYNQFREITYDLEEDQIRKNVGMTRKGRKLNREEKTKINIDTQRGILGKIKTLK